MPLYEYVCADCQKKFELRRSMKQIDDPAACPECHGTHTSRQMSRVACFSHGEGESVSALGGSGGCASCGGGTCASCGSSRN